MAEEELQTEKVPKEGEETTSEAAKANEGAREGSDLTETHRAQAAKLDARLAAIEQRELAFNAREREAKISGKALAVQTEKKVKDTPEEYAAKVLRGEANPLKDDKVIP